MAGTGEGSNCTGAAGADLEVKVPIGTVVYDYPSGERIHDFTEHGERFTVAKGGRGGRGNARFAHFHTSGAHGARTRTVRARKSGSAWS